MTIEQLVGKSADELEKMTDMELLEYFKPYLAHTRPPEGATAPAKLAARQTVGKNNKIEQAQRLLDMMDRGEI